MDVHSRLIFKLLCYPKHLSIILVYLIKTDSEVANKDFKLTQRELQILQRIGKGENYQEIADILFISPKTVRNHIENIYKKLQVHNKVDAVTVAIKNKLIVN